MPEERRVIVHVMHEERGARAAAILGVENRYDGGGLVESSASPDQIALLEAEGLLVELVEPVAAAARRERSQFRGTARYRWGPAAEWPILRDNDFREIDNVPLASPRLPSGSAVPLPPVIEIGAGGTYTAELPDFIHLPPLLLERPESLSRLLPDNVAILNLDANEARRLRREAPDLNLEPFNRSSIQFAPRPLDEAERAAIAPESGALREFDIIAHAPDRITEIEAWVALHAATEGFERVGAGSRKIRIRVNDTSPLLDEANLLDAVLDVRPVPVCRLPLDRTRSLVGIPAALPGQPELDGAGQIIGMTDGTVDVAHPDLAGRITHLAGPAAPQSAHGTHVAGIIAGSGAASAGQFRGIAPAAAIVAQALAVGPKGEVDLPIDLGDMLQQAYDAGARIHNLSIAEDNPASLYSVRADELDAFSVANPDMLIVVAAGNGGRTESNSNRPDGEVDLLSVASPGIAKNVLTVGACCSDRSAGHPAANWAAFPPAGRFRSPPTAILPLFGASAIAAFSGRGWGHGDNRLKPELVAPGTNIVAARAAGAADTLWHAHSPHYLSSGGTSMAAPVVAGCAALVRQHYANLGHTAPSSALLKATLAAGADWLNGNGAIATLPAPPNILTQPAANPDQGFGRVNVARSLALDGSGRTLCWVDVTASTATGTLSNGPPHNFRNDRDRQRFFFDCGPAPAAIDVAFAFIDAVPGPAGAVFSFTVTAPGSPPRSGNDRAVKTHYPLAGTPIDRVNNLQIIRLEPLVGRVEVQLLALALHGTQPGFALVVIGNVTNGLMHRF